MSHAEARFKEFIRSGTQIVDATKTTEALFSIAVESKQSVDNGVTKAVEAGGIADPYMLLNYGAECGMYTRSFADLDGHMWELVTMVGSCGDDKENY
jgi:predicted lactoylglutathione lyase